MIDVQVTDNTYIYRGIERRVCDVLEGHTMSTRVATGWKVCLECRVLKSCWAKPNTMTDVVCSNGGAQETFKPSMLNHQILN